MTAFSTHEFIELALSSGVLRFGQFQLKSGRQSPYFFNAGLFYQGDTLRRVGQFYANKLIEAGVDCNHLFGPAYKGLPLATATAIALAERGLQTCVSFNRKEAKDHGEGGSLIGSPLHGDVVMVDDVITAGTAFRESKTFIEAHGARLSTVIIALDRCEKGQQAQSTLAEIRQTGVNVLSIITLPDLIDYLKTRGNPTDLEKILSYQHAFGA